MFYSLSKSCFWWCLRQVCAGSDLTTCKHKGTKWLSTAPQDPCRIYKSPPNTHSAVKEGKVMYQLSDWLLGEPPTIHKLLPLGRGHGMCGNTKRWTIGACAVKSFIFLSVSHHIMGEIQCARKIPRIRKVQVLNGETAGESWAGDLFCELSSWRCAQWRPYTPDAAQEGMERSMTFDDNDVNPEIHFNSFNFPLAQVHSIKNTGICCATDRRPETRKFSQWVALKNQHVASGRLCSRSANTKSKADSMRLVA
jgi:hypothetical protein